MTELGRWLREQLKERDLTQSETAVYAGVGQATLSDIINKGHVPKVETLFRLADFFDTPRLDVVRMAAGEELAETEVAGREADAMVRKLVREFERLPAEWKAEAVAQVEMMNRLNDLSARSQARVIGEEAEDDEEADEETAGAS